MTHSTIKLSTALALVLALMACSESKDNQATYVRFAAPTAGAKIHGLADLQIATNLKEEPATLTLLLDGETVITFDQLASAIRLDTTRFDDGTQTLGLESTTEQGVTYKDEVKVEIDNPEHRFVRATNHQRAYGRGQKVKTLLEYTLAGLTLEPDFSVVDSEFDEGDVEIDDLGDGRYELRYTLSEDNEKGPGHYEVPITSTGSDSPSLVSYVTVQFLGAPQLPITVSAPNAVFTDQTIPIETSEEGPQIESIQVPERLIQGQAQAITLSWTASGDDPADRIVLSSQASSGTWVIPLSEPSTSGNITIPIEAMSSPQGLNATSIPLSAAVLGQSGTTRAATLTDMEVITMKLFGLKFLLNWSTSADLDLEVTTPDGSPINFVSPTAQNGELELDSNSMCSTSASFPMESISWEAKDMIPGTYGIRVLQFDACGQKVTPYQITILACGRAETIPGTFMGDDSSAVQEHVLSPFVMDCIQRIHGRITFDKDAPSKSDAMPAAGVPVRITGTGNPSEVVTTTNDNGEYDVFYPTANAANVMVHLEASWTLPGAGSPHAQVWGLTGSTPYTVTSLIGALSSIDVQHNLVIGKDESSGAFNILDIMRKAFIWTNSSFGTATAAKVTPLVARWNKGSGTPSKSGGSYYSCRTASDCTETDKAIWLGGHPNNPSEFADSVIAHEFSHHIAVMLNITTAHKPRPDGTYDENVSTHTFSGRIAPYFAWSEGVATGLGQTITDSPTYFSGGPRGGFKIEIEATPKSTDSKMDATEGNAYGTVPANDVTGKVNEFLVAGILWDLLDGANEPGNDEITSSPWSTSSTLARYLSTPLLTDRGGAGIDLVDFLDGWRCYRARSLNRAGLTYSDDSLLQLVKYRLFAYEPPATATTCF